MAGVAIAVQSCLDADFLASYYPDFLKGVNVFSGAGNLWVLDFLRLCEKQINEVRGIGSLPRSSRGSRRCFNP